MDCMKCQKGATTQFPLQKSAEKEKWKEGERGWCGKHNKRSLPPIWDTLKSEMIVKRKGKYIYEARTQNARQTIWKCCHGEHRQEFKYFLFRFSPLIFSLQNLLSAMLRNGDSRKNEITDSSFSSTGS